jgi:disulfide bond formation protein DsbB
MSFSTLARPWFLRAWRYWPAVAAAAAATTLAIAHGFEAAGYEPCPLCLRQREVYWGVLAIAAISAFFWARRPESRVTRAVEALLGAAFLTGALVAIYHAGVEWKFWPGPASCSGSQLGGLSGADIAKALTTGGHHVVLCTEAAWRDPAVHLSMAGWNALLSLGLAAVSFLAASRGAADFVEPVRVEPQRQG